MKTINTFSTIEMDVFKLEGVADNDCETKLN